jgi:hypothetical protein
MDRRIFDPSLYALTFSSPRRLQPDVVDGARLAEKFDDLVGGQPIQPALGDDADGGIEDRAAPRLHLRQHLLGLAIGHYLSSYLALSLRSCSARMASAIGHHLLRFRFMAVPKLYLPIEPRCSSGVDCDS